jgi:NAD(P)-dependent dehydrogenase (short-subunit alcohol dehydrogenase family)
MITPTEQTRPTFQVALVTGGCGWLGSAFCLALAEMGAIVVVTSREVERAEAQAAALPTPSGQVHVGVALNHLEEASIESGFAAALAKCGKVAPTHPHTHAC